MGNAPQLAHSLPTPQDPAPHLRCGSHKVSRARARKSAGQGGAIVRGAKTRRYPPPRPAARLPRIIWTRRAVRPQWPVRVHTERAHQYVELRRVDSMDHDRMCEAVLYSPALWCRQLYRLRCRWRGVSGVWCVACARAGRCVASGASQARRLDSGAHGWCMWLSYKSAGRPGRRRPVRGCTLYVARKGSR